MTACPAGTGSGMPRYEPLRHIADSASRAGLREADFEGDGMTSISDNDLWEWAWTQYQKTARELPDCEHVRAWKAFLGEARKMQLFGLHLQDKGLQNKGGHMPKQSTREPQVKIVAVAEMDDDIFVKHFNARHKNSLANMTNLTYPIDFNIWQLYISFHYRLHNTLIDLDHYHEPDSMESRVDRAIECLIERAWRGWFEIAGVEGCVAVFPGEDIATRIKGVVIHHKHIEEATDRLLSATTPMKRNK